MEVHHHTQTPRKKWAHYFWEFLMLFLAVTLGFLVENQREHYIEHNREKQFIASLYNDVKADIANLARIIVARDAKERAIDSLAFMMNDDSVKFFAKRIYFYAAGMARTLRYRFVANDGTMQQLKNSGALRLIRKRAVVDSIAKYDVSVRNLLGQQVVEENLINDYRNAATKIFDALVYKHMIDKDANIVALPTIDPRMQPYSDRELFEWNYRMYGIDGIIKANRRDGRLLLKQAENLIALLKKEYHLE